MQDIKLIFGTSTLVSNSLEGSYQLRVRLLFLFLIHLKTIVSAQTQTSSSNLMLKFVTPSCNKVGTKFIPALRLSAPSLSLSPVAFEILFSLFRSLSHVLFVVQHFTLLLITFKRFSSHRGLRHSEFSAFVQGTKSCLKAISHSLLTSFLPQFIQVRAAFVLLIPSPLPFIYITTFSRRFLWTE